MNPELATELKRLRTGRRERSDGGMDEVYRTQDQKFGCDMAIKILPEEFVRDAARGRKGGSAQCRIVTVLMLLINHEDDSARGQRRRDS